MSDSGYESKVFCLWWVWGAMFRGMLMRVQSVDKTASLRVQVLNNHILTPNLYYHYYSPNPKYLTIGYMDLLGLGVKGAEDLKLRKQTGEHQDA